MTSRYRIGLVGDFDHLRRPLRDASYSPVGGPFCHAVTSEIEQLLGGGRVPVLIADLPDDPACVAWVRRLLHAGHRLVVVGGADGDDLAVPRRVSRTASLADALSLCGASGSMVPETFRDVPLIASEPVMSPPPVRDATGAESDWTADDPVELVFDGPRRGGPAHTPAPVLVVFGARGGLGKTSVAQALAGTAAAAGLRTVLVDANREQPDQTLLLRLDPDRPVPSVYDAARSGRPEDAVASPGELDRLRGVRRDKVRFALAAGPPAAVPGAAEACTPAVYRRVVDHAARVGDLVVVDTHPVSASHPTDMVTGLVLPLLRGGAWGLGLTDSSVPGLRHLEETLDFLTDRGVPPDRLLTLVNRAPRSAELDMTLLGSRLARRSHWIGPIHTDDEDIQNRSNAGVVLTDVPAMAHQVEQVLSRVAGLEVRTAPPGRRRRGPLRRLTGRAG
ncbi:hypothetical protein [Microlunatus ginsengisoli]|uniref:MinD-like ATPase involved in chromosome partitioning or flagellar assembly n=1 Tax=Microlunatus ginsengisoli TaxID=363863 RepID=A0ABP7AMC6_9ACTN